MQLFLLFGLFFICYLLALIVTLGISLAGIPLEKIAAAGDLAGLLNFNLHDPEFVNKLKWAQLASSVLIFIVPPFVFAYLTALPNIENKKNRLFSFLDLDKPFAVFYFLIIPVLMIASLPLINVLAEINSAMKLPGFLSEIEQWMIKAEEDAKQMTEAFLKMENTSSLVFNITMVALIPAFGEELLFRGVVQKIFSKWTKNSHWGIWIAAALFSAMHGQFFGFLPRMVLGGLLGYLLYWSGSLWVPVLAHFINNGSAVFVSFLIQSGAIPKEAENIGTGKDEIYFIVVGFIMVLVLIWLVYNRRIEGGKKIQDKGGIF